MRERRRATNHGHRCREVCPLCSHGGVDACELYHCLGAGIALNVPVVAGGKGAEVRSVGATVELRRR
jgi:hypothetical protein